MNSLRTTLLAIGLVFSTQGFCSNWNPNPPILLNPLDASPAQDQTTAYTVGKDSISFNSNNKVVYVLASNNNIPTAWGYKGDKGILNRNSLGYPIMVFARNGSEYPTPAIYNPSCDLRAYLFGTGPSLYVADEIGWDRTAYSQNPVSGPLKPYLVTRDTHGISSYDGDTDECAISFIVPPGGRWQIRSFPPNMTTGAGGVFEVRMLPVL